MQQFGHQGRILNREGAEQGVFGQDSVSICVAGHVMKSKWSFFCKRSYPQGILSCLENDFLFAEGGEGNPLARWSSGPRGTKKSWFHSSPLAPGDGITINSRASPRLFSWNKISRKVIFLNMKLKLG